MSFRLPDALSGPDDADALELLRRYYGGSPGSPLRGPLGGGGRTGPAFDTWDAAGTRQADRNRFTPDDLVAVSLLSVNVPGRAALRLLRDQAELFTGLLKSTGDDRDLAAQAEPTSPDTPVWQLSNALHALPGVGPVTASKLLARKRPRLVPIWDTVVIAVIGTDRHLWEPLRQALRERDGALQDRLEQLRGKAGLPEQVSALRVFDVIAWREGKDKDLGSTRGRW